MIKIEINNGYRIFPETGKILLFNGAPVNDYIFVSKSYNFDDLIEVDDASYVPPEEIPDDTPDPLETLKKNQIKLSKNNLSKYLEEHPLFSKCKYEEGRYYNVTSEKQQQLTSKVLMATMYYQAGIPYKLTWNDTGDVCEEWELTQLQQLSMEIDGYVTPLVSVQQHIEVDIRNCTTEDEILQVNVEFTEDNINKYMNVIGGE